MIASREEAIERAGRCIQHANLDDIVLDGTELLGHPKGYIWAVYYAQGKQRTHVVLIHADGTPLAREIAAEIISADGGCGGDLGSLIYVAPPNPSADRAAAEARARERYRQWLSEECGFIHFDGLPADQDLSAVRLRLETLFVPAHATVMPPDDDYDGNAYLPLTAGRSTIGELLQQQPRLAILAMPGGGKSTPSFNLRN